MTRAKCDAGSRLGGGAGAGLLGGLLGLSIVLLAMPRLAHASCDPDPPADGDVVTCTGQNLATYEAPPGVNNVVVNIEPGATFTTISDAVRVNDDSLIRLRGDVTVNGADSAGLLGHSRTGIVIFSGSSVILNSPGSRGVLIDLAPGDDYANGAVDHAGDIIANGDSSWGIGVAAGTDVISSGTITLNGADSRGIRGFNQQGDSQGGGLIDHSGTIDLFGTDSVGIDVDDHYDVTHTGTIRLGGADGTGIRAGANAGVTIALPGVIDVDAAASNGFGVQVGDNGGIGLLGSITSQAAGFTAMQGAADSTLTNDGTLSLMGDRSSGMVGGTDATIVNRKDAFFEILGDDSVGIEIGMAGVGQNFGLMVVDGTNSIGAVGLDGRNGDNSDNVTRFTNEFEAVLMVTGDGSRGVRVGELSSVTNQGLIEVSGDDSAAIEIGRAGAVTNRGIIRFSGTDSVGVITGGNATRDLFHFANSGFIGVPATIESLDPDAGPVIRLRPSTTIMTRVANVEGAVIRADLRKSTQSGRGVAIEGSTGDDQIDNRGLIEGKISLGAGSDEFIQRTTGVLTYIEDGQIDAGAQPGDMDRLVLSVDDADPEVPQSGFFDIGLIQNFEELNVERGTWRVEGTAQSPIDLSVELEGTLQVSSPLDIDGGYSHAVPAVDESAPPAMRALLREVSPGTPVLHLSGIADLDGRALRVDVGGGLLGAHTITVLEADGGLQGAFSEILLPGDPGLAFGTPLYMGNTLSIPLFVSGYTDNQLATNLYLQRSEAAGASAELQTIIDDLNTLAYTPYKQAMLQLHGEAYDAHASATLELANAMTQITLQRPRYCVAESDQESTHPQTGMPCRERRWEPWLTLFGHTGTRTGSDDHTSWEDSAGALLFGVDRRFGNRFLVSGTIGSSYDSLDVAEVGKGRITTVDIGVATQYQRGPLHLEGALSYGHGWHNQFRNIRIPNFAKTSQGEYALDRVGVRVGGAWGFDVRGFRLAPLASLDYSALIRPGLTETGAHPLNLVLDGATDHVVTVRVGGELAYTYNKNAFWTQWLEATDGIWRPGLSLRWRQVVSGYERDITGRFIGAPLDAGQFTVTGDDAQQGFEIGAGVDFTPENANRLTFGLGYEGFVWENVSSHNLMGRIRLSF